MRTQGTDRSRPDVLVRSGDVRAWKKSYSVANVMRACVLYRDIFVLRGKQACAYDDIMAGRPQNRTLLMLPFFRFPSLPVELASALPLQGLFVCIPSVAFYFSNCIQSGPESVRIRFDIAFLLEWGHNVAAALILEVETHARV